MWPFKSKPVETKEKKQVLKFKPEADYEVGCTQIEVSFDDGRKFITNVFGVVDQQYGSNNYAKRRVIKSEIYAGRKLSELPTHRIQIYDGLFPMKEMMIGTIDSAKVINTIPHTIKYAELYYEEEQ